MCSRSSSTLALFLGAWILPADRPPDLYTPLELLGELVPHFAPCNSQFSLSSNSVHVSGGFILA